MIAAILHLNALADVPLFIQFFVIFMSIYHSSMFIMLKEIQKASPSTMWNNLSNANFLGIILTLVTASLLHELHNVSNIGHRILILAAVFDVATHYFANLTLYYLITPIIKKKINIFRAKYLILHVSLVIVLYFIASIVYNFKYPPSTHFVALFVFILFSMVITIHYSSSLLYIARGYAEIGFVRKPFLIGGIGMISYLISVSLIIYYIVSYLTPAAQKNLYYNISLYSIFFVFTILYFFRFVIEYPALLEPKWKTLMPFDLPKVAASLTLAFLAMSLYLTAKEYPNFIIYQNIPYSFVIAFLLPVFLGTILIFTYLNTLSSRTKLKYWRYLKYGLYIHITVTFYVLSLIFLSWNNAMSSTKMLFAMFGIVTFAFYLFFALDLRTILKDQNIKPIFDRLDFSLYLVFFCSIFFLIFFGISFAYGKVSDFIGIEIISYPVILFLIFFFLIAFGAYLSITHKGFEEIMRKNIWSELSYIFAFIVFLLVYLIYSSLNTHLQQFPYHNFAFIGYFTVLIIEIVSTRTLAEKSKYTKTKSEDIVHLLNFYAHNFLRTDYLEDLWEKTLDRYVLEDEVKKIGFGPAGRRFDLGKANEKTMLNIAVGMLLEMHKIPNLEKVTILRKSIEETKEEIVNILKEKILLLPDDLRSEFDERLYYPILYERTINDLLEHLKTFIPLTEQRNILDRLKRRDELFTCIEFEGEEISIKKGTMFNRDDFLKLFKLYLEVIGGKFPFKRFLLYELVREEIKNELELYNITVGEVLDIVSTGLERMDKIMAGGFVKGSTTLLIAEETKAKNKILLSFIKRAMTEETGVIYATSKRPFQQIIGELRMDIKSLKNFVMLDLYENLYTETRISGLVEEEHRIIVPLNKIMFQRSIVKTIKSHPKDYAKTVIIDVYDELSRYYNPVEIHELLQKQIEGLKRWNCTSVIVLDPHSYLITREGVEEVKRHFDNILLLSGGEKDTSVFIEKLYHGTPSKHVIRLPW